MASHGLGYSLNETDRVGCVIFDNESAQSWRRCLLGYHATRPAPYCLRHLFLHAAGPVPPWEVAPIHAIVGVEGKYGQMDAWGPQMSPDIPEEDRQQQLQPIVFMRQHDGAGRITAWSSSQVEIPVIIASMPRDRAVLNETLFRLNSLDAIGAVHVFGFCPGAASMHKVHCYPFPRGSSPQQALQGLQDAEVPVAVLAGNDPLSGIDTAGRARWRASIALDMWAVLGEAQRLLPGEQDFLWMENDVCVRQGFVTACCK